MARRKRILASDLDGTLIPPANVDGAEGVAAFRERVEGRDDLLLAYVTGRHFEHALEGIEGAGLPAPDVLVCDVGTSLHRRVGDGFEEDGAYAEQMRTAMGGHTCDDARAVLDALPLLELQDADQQAEFKASFYFPWERRRDVEEHAAGALSGAGVRANLVTSREPGSGRGLLDALPPGVAKDRALPFLERLVTPAPARLVFAGDSGNDRAALLAGCEAIVVGNADPELVAELRAEAEARGLSERIYFAKAPYAAGVLEGCRHFGVL